MNHRLARFTLAAAVLTVLFAGTAQAQAPAAGRPLPGCHDPRAIARFLGLTADQAAHVKELRATYKTTVDPIQKQIGELRDQIQDLLDATTPDACQIGALHVQIHTLYQTVEAARTTFEHAFEALLTPAQLVKWNALQAVCSANDETTGS
jgi:Spy/CpxP family protein refolding chaperone